MILPAHACLLCSRRFPLDAFFNPVDNTLGLRFQCSADTLADEPLLFHFLSDPAEPSCISLINNAKIPKSGCGALLLPDDTPQEFKDLIK